MNKKQNGTTVIILKNGQEIKVKEDATVVNAKYNEADSRDADDLMRWMGSDGRKPFPHPNNKFRITEKGTDKEISLSPQQVMEITVKGKKASPFDKAGNTKVILNDGEEFNVEENFDTIYAAWNGALIGDQSKSSVLVLTEKVTKNRLAILAKNIVRLSEL